MRTKFLLDEDHIPTHWYNVLADMDPPPPPIDPRTGQPVGPEALIPLFPLALIQQEVSTERYIPIPDEVREVYKLWRPTPLFRARRLEQALDTPARIYYKYEGVSPAGSHKPNTAVAQAYYNKAEGVRRLTTETGAGQWGSALAMACAFFGIQLKVYMVKVSYHQKPYRRVLMETWGAQVVPSPSPDTEAGRRVLREDPESPGSLGIAISEAVEDAASRDDTKYSLGSVLNHVLLHQTVIGLEALQQMEMAGDYPDVVIGCVGGGSNYAGLALPFVRDKLTQGRKTRFIAVEPEACPSITRGQYTYDFGDTAATTPLLKMHTLGHTFIPPSIHAGGLRYHGMAPIISKLVEDGVMEARAYHQTKVFEAAVQFARAEGIVPAPESAHAVRAAIDEALAAREAGEQRVILFNLSGHGLLDLAAYDQYLTGRLEDYAYPEEKVREALAHIPKVGG
ncbi:MAG: TrpB-like pyridoxal phosphate-dependent enzyme [Dehalococcoidia bacterium]|jgi:tryptophan synthase beta chain|nr:TrpB-like pyridoxal phosphate-dependent enzyme [Dehalococcoidia bacterium]